MKAAPDFLFLRITRGGRASAWVTRFVIVVCVVACCGVVNAEARKVEWTPKLQLKNLSSIGSRLREPFESAISVTKDGRHARVSNCVEYLKLSALHFAPSSDRDVALLKFRGIDCQALQALQKAKPARTSFLDNFHLDAQAVDYLPPDFAPAVSAEDSQKARDAGARGLSWRQFQPGLAVKPDVGSLKAETDGTTTKLEIYARGDLNGDGMEDLLIRVDVSFTAGSYTDSRLFLLTRESTQGRLKILREYK